MIMRYVADVNAQWDIAKAGIRNYREYLKGLFAKDQKR